MKSVYIVTTSDHDIECVADSINSGYKFIIDQYDENIYKVNWTKPYKHDSRNWKFYGEFEDTPNISFKHRVYFNINTFKHKAYYNIDKYNIILSK